MSREALEMHWGVHHRDYVDSLNKQLQNNDPIYGYTMEEMVKFTYNSGNPLPEFNNVAEVRWLITDIVYTDHLFVLLMRKEVVAS